jgi:phosphatidate cytidylyltransferase
MADNIASPKPPRWADLGVRTASAAVLIPAVIVDVYAGGVWFELFVALLCVLVAHEWTTLTHGRRPLQFALHALAALCGSFLPGDVGLGSALIAVLAIAALSAILAAAGRQATAWSYAGVLYAGLPAIALVVLREDVAHGTAAIFWMLAIVWSADTLAYFAGRTIGGPKLAPAISPNKTWAGLIGAMAGAGVASAICAAVMGLTGLLWLAALGAVLAVVEQGGDLFKSAWKRHFGVKDSGALIPGHGGVIDRVDGMLAVAIVAAAIGVIRAGAGSAGGGLLLW